MDGWPGLSVFFVLIHGVGISGRCVPGLSPKVFAEGRQQ